MGEQIINAAVNFVKTHLHGALILYFAVYIPAFFAVEAFAPTEGYWVTDTALDEYIPFIPQFVYAYILWYPLFAAVGIPLLINDEPAFRRYMYFIMTSFTAALAFCALVPNGQDLRPGSVDADSLSGALMTALWAVDTNTNVFPSMHILGAIAGALAAFDSDVLRKWRWILLTAAVLIALSTVFIKQHAVIDVLGAAAFAVPPFFLFYRERFSGGKIAFHA